MDASSFPICAFCLDEITPLDKIIMPKGCRIHDPFHERCLQIWITIQPRCPIDKNPIDRFSCLSYKEVLLINLKHHLGFQAQTSVPFLICGAQLDWLGFIKTGIIEDPLFFCFVVMLGAEIGLFSKNISDLATRWLPDRTRGIDFVQAGAMLVMAVALSHIPFLSGVGRQLVLFSAWGTYMDTGRLCWRS